MGNKGYPKPKRYYPKNLDKYRSQIGRDYAICRSGLEKKAFRLMDTSPAVKWWSSEELVIRYKDPTKKGRKSRYYIDIVANMEQSDGSEKILLIEIKPSERVKAPKLKGKAKKAALDESRRYLKNVAKWKAAQKHAKKMSRKMGIDVEFKIMTEKNLGISYK